MRCPMLSQPLLDRLTTLGLTGFRAALEDQRQSSQYTDLPFCHPSGYTDRVGLGKLIAPASAN